MDILFRKEQKVCGTCIHWNGSKEVCGDSIKIDFISYGSCEHTDKSHMYNQLTPSHYCSKYILYPALNY